MALLLALVIPILAACGGTAAPAAQPTAAPAAAATAAPAAAATAAPAAAATAAPEATATTGGATKPAGNTLRIAESTWPDTLDPQDSSFTNEIAVEILNYEGLTRLDKDLKTVPAAAEKWEYNSDATELTFTLRDGLKYSDGSPLTSQDFLKGVYRTLDPRGVVGDYQTIIDMVKGADAIIGTEVPTDEAKLPDLFKALGVTAPDDKTIKFTFTKPTPYFHTIASLWVFYPAKQDLIDKGGEQWYEDAANQIGNGPFQITKIDKSANLIEYKPNENYWGGKPKLDGVQLKFIDDLAVALQAYKNGEVDVMTPDPNDVPSIQADAALGKEYLEYAGSCTLVVQFNLTKAPFDNLKVRQAFSYGFDREAYIRDVLKGTDIPTLTWIPPGYPGYDASETRFGFDPAKAKATLAEAGFADGKGFPEVKLSYNSNNPANQARAEYLVQMYQKSLGVTLVPDPVEGTTLVNMRKDVSTYPQFLNGGGWCADYPDPQNWLSVYWHSRTNFAKNTGYKNADVDKLLDQADIELDATKRADLYQQAQKLIVGDVGEIMRSNTKNNFLVKPYVKNIGTTPQDSDYPGQALSLFTVTIEQ
ncbi:MAG: peptide ABC transporter substrate-binding protein [Kouleothrix sp.]|nr:peptide ABC transporter substrate-binding protein [Kouleothrix sp.]